MAISKPILIFWWPQSDLARPSQRLKILTCSQTNLRGDDASSVSVHIMK